MLPHARHIAAATLALVLCRTGVGQGNATVIRNTPGNPPVETGGHHLPPKSWPAMPYSVIGALQDETRSCVWPWRWFASFLHHHGDPRQKLGNLPTSLPPLP